MKECIRCHQSLPYEIFYKQARAKDGHYPYCKPCSRRQGSAWDAANRERNRECSKAKYRRNLEANRASKTKWRNENIEKARESSRQHRARNLDQVRAYMREHQREMRKSPQVRISLSISRRMWESLRQIEGKQSRRWESLVGYTKEELMAHLERQFSQGMSWANYGEWHIDHVIPLSSFDFTSTDDTSFKRAWSLPNLRPLWAAENVRKNAKRVFLI